MSIKKKAKIAFIHPDLGIGGAERLVLDVASALKQQNYDIVFLTNHYDKSHSFEELINNEFPVEVYGDWIPRSIFGAFQAFCAYIRMIYLSIVCLFLCHTKENPPDLYFVDLIPTAIPFLRLAKKKVIYYCHHPDLLASPPGGFWKRLYRMPLNWIEEKSTGMADLILVNSQYTASIFLKTFPSVKQSIHILYPTIAHSYIKEIRKIDVVQPMHEIVPELPYVENAFVFLSINRFHPAKNLDLAIHAMAKLQLISDLAEWEKIFCIIAGGYDPINKTNYETYEKLFKLVGEYKLHGKIIFLKSPSDKLKANLLMSCSGLLYTPLKEHFGIVPLEAMLASKPVIAIDSGGPKEVVIPEETGYLCKETPDDMAEFMYKLFKVDSIRMGIRGKEVVEEKFSFESFSNKLRIFIDHLLYDKKVT